MDNADSIALAAGHEPECAIAQRQFNALLARYVNSGALGRADIALGLAMPARLFTKHAPLVARRFVELAASLPAGETCEQITVGPYQGSNPYVLEMSDVIATRLAEDVAGAYVHGSLGSYEEMPYSDFDALVILNDAVFQSPQRLARVASELNRACSIMYRFDPLQHHGWFVLTEADLDFYSDACFPVDLYRHAKAMWPMRPHELRFRVRDSHAEAVEGLRGLASSIGRRLAAGAGPAEFYGLKSVLSEFMLLPALYVQVKSGRGLFKRECFALARQDFTPAEWRVMDEVSGIRSGWTCELTASGRRLLASRGPLRRALAHRVAPRIPGEMLRKLRGEIYPRMRALADRMSSVSPRRNLGRADV